MGRYKLNAFQVEKLAPLARDKKYFDGAGLFLLVKKSGSKLWRYKYSFAGKEKTLSIGPYPLVSLKKAREFHTQAMEMLLEGKDPSIEKQKQRHQQSLDSNELTFESIYHAWRDVRAPQLAPATQKKNSCLVEKNLLPYIGMRSITDLTRIDFVICLDRVVARGAISTAKRLATLAHTIMLYAANRGLLDKLCTTDLQKAIYQTQVSNHYAAITNPKEFGKLLVKIENYQGSFEIRSALALAPMLFQRPGEVLAMEWSEVDLENATWTIPLSKKKERKQVEGDHIVPLPHQAVFILKEIWPLTGRGRYVFRNQRTPKKPKPTESLNKALRNLGYCTKTQQCAHGFRASARTLLDEQLQIKVEWIESQLSHAVHDTNGRAYNRTSFLPQRIEMMQAWADYLDELKREHLSSKKIEKTKFETRERIYEH